MANYTGSPDDDEYDVLIDGDLPGLEAEPCDGSVHPGFSGQQEGPLCASLFALGILANVLLLAVLVRCKGLKHVENICPLNLVLSSLGLLLPLPIWAHVAWRGGGLSGPACTILLGLQSFGLSGEAFFTVLLLVQRSHVKWLSWALGTGTRGIVTSALVWATSVLVTMPELVLYKPRPGEQSAQCSFSTSVSSLAPDTFWKRFLTVKTNALALGFPLAALLCGCVRVGRGPGPRGLFGLAWAVAFTFLVMWAPYHIALFLSTFKGHISLDDCRGSSQLDAGIRVTKAIATAHCCLNLLLFGLLDPALRRQLHALCSQGGNAPLRPNDRKYVPGTSLDSQNSCTKL